MLSVAPDAVAAGAAEKRADDDEDEDLEEEDSPSVGIKQVECNDLRNGVEQEVAAPLNVKVFPADERDKCLAMLKPRANPKLRVEAMIAIDTAPRDGFMLLVSSPNNQR